MPDTSGMATVTGTVSDGLGLGEGGVSGSPWPQIAHAMPPTSRIATIERTQIHARPRRSASFSSAGGTIVAVRLVWRGPGVGSTCVGPAGEVGMAVVAAAMTPTAGAETIPPRCAVSRSARNSAALW